MSVTAVNREQQNSIREELLDVVTTLSPKDRPILAACGRQNVKNSTVTWTTDALASRDGANAKTHGNTISFAAADWKARVQVTNYTQLMERKVSVDKSINDMEIAGVPEGEWERQKALKLDELLNDLEAMLASNNTATAPLPNTGTAGLSAGMQSTFTQSVVDASKALYGKQLTKAGFNALSQLIFAQGGNPDKVFLGAQAKDAIAAWVQQVNRPVSDSGKKLTDVVNQVETTTGFQDLLLSRDCVSVLIMTESKYNKVGWLTAPRFELLYPDADIYGGYQKLEATFISLAPKASGKITGLGYTV